MVLKEALRQFSEGHDFWSMADLTGDLTPNQACQVSPGMPYSIATQLEHARFWQDKWLEELRTGAKVEVDESMDFGEVSAEEWPALRQRYLEGLQEAERYTGSPDADKARLLLKIVLHGSYHIGQVALLRQASGFGYPPGV